MHRYSDCDRREVAALVPVSTRRLLDIGCARGAFGALLVERGIEVWGVEPDEESAIVAADRLTKVIVGSYPAAVPPGERFDCITFNDTLEHLLDPRGALIAARDHLSAGGVLVASIPNVQHASVALPLLLKGRWDYTEDGLLDNTHLRFFTKQSMRGLLESAGFVVDEQLAINITPMHGLAHVFRVLGSRREQLLAEQYLLRARPA